MQWTCCDEGSSVVMHNLLNTIHFHEWSLVLFVS